MNGKSRGGGKGIKRETVNNSIDATPVFSLISYPFLMLIA